MPNVDKPLNLFQISSFDYTSNQEIMNILMQTETIRIEHIVSYGQTSNDWYDQNENEWLVLLQGQAAILYENGNEISLAHGDTLYIPAHQKHKVSFTSAQPPCIWLAVFLR
jgi:cupin 2 domain-containing protein